MLNGTTIVMKQILEVYKGFEQLKLLVDVGGGLGVTLNLITSRYSHIKGINFDLPHVIQHGPPYPGIIFKGKIQITPVKFIFAFHYINKF